ncbi:aldo/keto reductase [Myxococcus llanfairpwllgwyngyllgogerychwyrndrobwllllantysiliogogogochensis]|uniref:Aldo/keto reductase n=1 Tax=Myxococcus llanfairpwllgwyngyllgogerychwyrndrobwllllantysiliogogogochensis TaxID=2590453 RepID=A0A540X1B3_9BACT|nr:myxosortase-dependent M36 family metallopeptidase [Myxococcus llanfairpwllgwyngyllgogerychwyrndrobwllllantysiliogogogochensis]TQF15039.1 aldo/keto reductase [Myxococcus llanfairpwllgwyngyllgogerychwyrndrobwllllantysiliogogogochensis]
MKTLLRTLAGVVLALAGTRAGASAPPNHDALLEHAPARDAGAMPPEGAFPDARVLHTDSRLGVPTFVWASKPMAGAARPLALRADSAYARMTPATAARAQLDALAPLYGDRSLSQEGVFVASTRRSPLGSSVVTLRQEVGGVEVFRGGVRLLLDSRNVLVAASGHLARDSGQGAKRSARGDSLGATQAAAVAFADLTGQSLDASLLRTTGPASGRYTRYELASYARPLPVSLRLPARIKPVLFELPEGLIPAHYVELNTGVPESSTSDYYAYVIAADDGRVLFRNDLTADAAHSYRVWADATTPYTPFAGPSGNEQIPHPTGTPNGYVPPFVERNLVTLDSAPFSRNDPWLPVDATETTGNNVDAYVDASAPDGFGPGDVRGHISGPATFDYPYSFDLLPYETPQQLQSAVTQLFYVNNWLHDDYYDVGFDEAAGNGQQDNLGRGGLGGDRIKAEAQDYSGVNNANMATPADGASPRMQMYIFTGTQPQLTFEVTAPEEVARPYTFIAAQFSPRFFAASARVVQALDAADAAGPSTTDGCSALTNAAEIAGQIALVDRGTCGLHLKVLLAQAAGATGVIIANSPGQALPAGMGATEGLALPAIGAVMIQSGDAELLRKHLSTGVWVTLAKRSVGDLDGTIDTGIVAHEWGHYISNRLVHDGAGLGNNQGRSMGEGWADFHALLMMVREEDAQVASNPNWTGVFPTGEYATRNMGPDSSYFGIRRVPYSVDFRKNPLTLQHMSNGIPLPSGVAYAFGADGSSNAEYHNAGEVWASMLWECYVALLRDTSRLTFAEAQRRMKSYLVLAYTLTPASPTFLEARDALLAAAYAGDPVDFERFSAAFARRGAGIGAVAPDRASASHAGVVESYRTGPDVMFVSAELTDEGAGEASARTCDADGYLDNGETGVLRITLRGTGSEPLRATSVTVTADSPGVKLANGGQQSFPVVGLFETATVDIPVSLTGAAPRSLIRFAIAYRDANGVVAGDKTATLVARVEQDELPGASAVESVDARYLPWEMTSALGDVSFRVNESSTLERAFLGEAVGRVADFALVSPELQVGQGALSFSFRHRYSFETSGGEYFDGGVIELSEDGGKSWTDIGESIVLNGYTGVLTPYEGNVNPLVGRRAFRGASFAFSQNTWITTNVNLGTRYAGKAVHIRFRIGTDEAVGAAGWFIDSVGFTGLTQTPFTVLTDEQGLCTSGLVRAEAGEGLAVDEHSLVSLHGSGSSELPGVLAYRWEQVAGPVVTLSDAQTATPSFTAPEVIADTTLTFRLTVLNEGLQDRDTVQVLVRQVNQAPVAFAGPAQTVDEGGSVTLQGSGEDPEGDVLVGYRWTQVSGPAVTLTGAETSTPSFTAPAVARGSVELTFQLKVGDGLLESEGATVSVTVRHVALAPTVSAGEDLSTEATSSVTLTASAEDPEQGTLTYAWRQSEGPSVSLKDGATAGASFTAPEVSAPTTLTFIVKVTAESGLSAEDSVTVSVSPKVVPPKESGCSATGTPAMFPLTLLLLALLARRRREAP